MKKVGRRKEKWEDGVYSISQKFLDVRGVIHEIKGVAKFNEDNPQKISKEAGRDIAEKKYFLNLFKFKLKEDTAEYKVMKNFATQILSMTIKGSASIPTDNIQYQLKKGGEENITILEEIMRDPVFKYRNRIVSQLQHKQYDIARDKEMIKESEKALHDCLIFVEVMGEKKEKNNFSEVEYDETTKAEAEELLAMMGEEIDD